MKKIEVEKFPNIIDIRGEKRNDETVQNDYDIEKENKRTVQVFKTLTTAKKMKILSELSLEQSDLPFQLKKGESYHCFSFGDVDSLTYLKHVIRQQNIDHLILSTWCMALEDCKEIDSWIDKGALKCVDFYVGEIFKGGYRGVYDEIKRLARKTGGRVARFRNHSKVMVVFGERFDCLIESSANINTNPRCENTCITVDTDLCYFYKDIFDHINSFDKGFENWKPK